MKLQKKNHKFRVKEGKNEVKIAQRAKKNNL